MPKRFIFMGLFILIVALASWVAAERWQKNNLLKSVEKTLPTLISQGEKIKIVTSLFPWYDLAREIGGERISVSLLLPPGTEAHSFEPTPGDMIAVSKADLFVYTGDYLEPWAQDIIDSFEGAAGRSLALGESAATLVDEDEESGLDPHIWLDPMIMDNLAGRLAQKLADLDPTNRSYYNQRLENYRASLEKLDVDYREKLSKCAHKEFIYAGHYAFGYLAARYGLQYEAAQGFSPDAESSPQRLTELADLIKEKNIAYIFAEELDNPQLAETLARKQGVTILFLNSAHNLSKADIKAGLSYEEIMRNNLDKLIIAFKCR
jgi:zinc transport system substrate-binding protein